MTDITNEPDDLHSESSESPSDAAPEIETPEAAIEDPIGDVTSGEAQTSLATESDLEEAAEEESEPEFEPKSRPPAKLDRLQKILAQAGVASRRKAEEMIEQGRVQVNGKIVTELGTKADAGRDHIRVDGKLLQGAERHRYFVLNKPRGFVTTVKDPEGRPTVMQFFEKMRERLYPVGRLDYMSEGLLLVTNDGDLANRLTRAAAGVEKTYLVKVAGQPTESELDILRSGVAIERGKPGSSKVRTSPARIRQVRQGDNPWYEVVLIEGRNRELRKMFEEIGHFVEKIRRVGYGPLVLDQEPGNLRELQPAELEALRAVAEGKLRTPKSKELRRRNALDAAGLPTVAPRPTIHPRPAKPFQAKPFQERPATADRPGEFRPKKPFAAARPARPAGPPRGEFRPAAEPAKRPFRRDEGEGSLQSRPPRPAWKKDDRPSRPPARFAADSPRENRPAARKPYGDKPSTGRTYGAKATTGGSYREKPAASRPFAEKPASRRPFGDKPSFNKPASGKPSWTKPASLKPTSTRPTSTDRPPYKRPSAPRREATPRDEDFGPIRPPNLHIEEIHESERPSRPSAPRPNLDRPDFARSRPNRSGPGRPNSGRTSAGRPSTGRSSSARPFRAEGGLARPFTTSSGKPRAGGPRPSSKPSSAAPKRPFRSKEGEGSFPPRTGKKTGWKPKPSGGPKRTGPRPSGKRPPSAHGGKKRG